MTEALKNLSTMIDVPFSQYSKADLEAIMEQCKLSCELGRSQVSALSILTLLLLDSKEAPDCQPAMLEDAKGKADRERELYQEFLNNWLSSNYGQAKMAGHSFWRVDIQEFVPFEVGDKPNNNLIGRRKKV